MSYETTDPPKALAIWDDLARQNMRSSLGLFLLGFTFPILGFLIAIWVKQSVENCPVVIAILIWALVGFMPGYVAWMRGLNRPIRELGLSDLYVVFLLPLLPIWMFLTIVLIASLITIPILLILNSLFAVLAYFFYGDWYWHMMWPQDIPRHTYFPFHATVVFVVGLYMVTDLPLTENPIKYMPLALKLRSTKVISFVIPLSAAFVIGGGLLDIFPGSTISGLLASVVAGLTFGITIARDERDDLLASIYRLGKARCLIRLSRHFEARYYIDEAREASDAASYTSSGEANEIITHLAYVTSRIMRRVPVDRLVKELHEAVDWLPSDEYTGILSESVQATSDLSGIEAEICRNDTD